MNVTKKLILSTNFGFCAIELVVADRALWQQCGGGSRVTIERFCSTDPEWGHEPCSAGNTCVPQIDKETGIIWYAQCKPRVHADPCEDLPDSPDTKASEKDVALWGRCIRDGSVTTDDFELGKGVYPCDIGKCVPQINRNDKTIYWYAQCKPNPCDIHNGGCDQNKLCTFDVLADEIKCDCGGVTLKTSDDIEQCVLVSPKLDACAECRNIYNDGRYTIGPTDFILCTIGGGIYITGRIRTTTNSGPNGTVILRFFFPDPDPTTGIGGFGNLTDFDFDLNEGEDFLLCPVE